MKRFMLNTLLLSLAVAFTGCGGSSDDDPQPATVSITASPESVSVPADGGSYTINVTTTGKEWGAYADADFITLQTQNTTSQTGSVTVVVPANPYTEARSGSVTLMSGSARKTVTVSQAAAEKPAYDAPEGYALVWQDEFTGTADPLANYVAGMSYELNANDWTHEVQNCRTTLTTRPQAALWLLRLRTARCASPALRRTARSIQVVFMLTSIKVGSMAISRPASSCLQVRAHGLPSG